MNFFREHGSKPGKLGIFISTSLWLIWANVFAADMGGYSLPYESLLEKRISLRLNNATLEEALQALAKEIDCSFSYSNTLLNSKHLVSKNYENTSLKEILTDLLGSRLRRISVSGNTVLLVLVGGMIEGQVLIASDRTPLPFATVRLEGTKRGMATREEGTFELKVPQPGDWTLVISAIGYKTVTKELTISAGQTRSVTVLLEESTTQMEEVIVTGERQIASTVTRTNVPVRDLPMPVMLIDGKQLEMMGSRRLNEVLQEQTGLALTTDPSGASNALGLQVQGFDASYTMIMIDGQPLIGRNAVGILDLSRITVANIDRIEIIKGTSSAMYGSDALAGVVNIITKGHSSTEAQGVASLRYGTNTTLDATVDAGAPILNNKATASVSANYYRTDGFDADPSTPGNTLPPFHSYALQGQVDYRIGGTDLLSTSVRYALRNQRNRYELDRLGRREDVNTEQDLILTSLLRNTIGNKTELTSQYYFTHYRADATNTDLVNDRMINENNFAQSFHRFESFANHQLSERVMLTGGIGGNSEILEASRYGDQRAMNTGFAYAQADYTPHKKLGVLVGARYDAHNIYGWQLSPRLGIRYHVNDMLTLKGSAGTGFKAPSFQQLYLSFTNPTAGYTILGAAVFEEEASRLQAEGEVANLFPVAEQIGDLKAERSTSFNAGFMFSPTNVFTLEVNAFSNDIRNMIFEELVGMKENGSQLFSYRNIEEAFTRGLETNAQWEIIDGLEFSVGYQLLYAKDKGVIEEIEAGEKEVRTSEGRRSVAEASDYFNLSNRSRHMANFKIFYEYQPWQMGASFRANFRGRYGLGDRNYPNNFIDPYDLYVEGFTLLNATLEKHFLDRKLGVQLICDNLLNFSDPLVPNLLGRQFLASLSWRWQNSENKK
ncbi:MAG: TonB-dependent receptor [Bacteroidota bacterium]